MSTLPETSIVRGPFRRDAQPEGSDPNAPAEFLEPVPPPRSQRLSPTTIAVVAVIAGVGAMALGGAAVMFADSSSSELAAAPTSPAPRKVVVHSVLEQRLVALLAKPSTQRIVFSGSVGRVVLAVGSGGRAAILLRGLARAAKGKPYYAWLIAPGAVPVRAARFVGTERAVFLSAPVARRAKVVIRSGRSVPGLSPPLMAAVRA